jgi:hypothetical protein
MRGAKLRDSYDAADYIATITAGLAEMAALQGWGTLVDVLEMARLEAEQVREHIHWAAGASAESNDLPDDRLAAVNGCRKH